MDRCSYRACSRGWQKPAGEEEALAFWGGARGAGATIMELLTVVSPCKQAVCNTDTFRDCHGSCRVSRWRSLAPASTCCHQIPAPSLVCALDTNTGIPPNSQGRNLSTTSNFARASSHCSAALLEKRVKSLHGSLDTAPPKFGHGNLPLQLGCSGHQARELSTELAPWYCCP